MTIFDRILHGRRASVVVEIGTDLLKIFQVREGRGSVQQQFLKVLKIADLKQPLEQELPAIFQSMGIWTRLVTTYLPRKLVTMRFFEVPSTDEGEVADMMRLQGIKQTPYAREEVAMAHALVGSRHEGMSDVVLAFCQRKFVDERVDLLERSGLKVHRVGVSTEGVVDWYYSKQADSGVRISKDLVVLIDQDLSFSDVIFCRDGKFLYSKSILSGSNQVSQGQDKGGELFCEEVMKAIEFTMEETQSEQPKKVVLIASSENGDSLRRALADKLQLPVEFYDPTSDLTLPEGALVQGGAVAALFGFGQHGEKFLFDMMPEDVKLSKSLEKRGLQMVTTTILALALLAVFGFYVAGSFYKKKDYLENLDREIAKTQEYAASIEEKLARIRLMEKVKNPDTTFLSYLKKITGVLAPGVYFSSIDYASDNQIVLKGYAGQMAEVFDFAKALEELKIFKAVKSERVSKKKEGDQVLAEFEIDCLL